MTDRLVTTSAAASRQQHVDRFYNALAVLEDRIGSRRMLRTCNGRMEWPARGVYFFFEPGEIRAGSSDSPRVVRVGTHAVSAGSKSRLWGRLAQHRGNARSGGGNHRGSVFRLLVGAALAQRDPALPCAEWGKGGSAERSVLEAEQVLERAVSDYLGNMTILWLPADDEPSKDSIRGYVERNAIALLSHANVAVSEILDPPSAQWLGRLSHHEHVRTSGLWNANYVRDKYDPEFLPVLERLIQDVVQAPK